MLNIHNDYTGHFFLIYIYIHIRCEFINIIKYKNIICRYIYIEYMNYGMTSKEIWNEF